MTKNKETKITLEEVYVYLEKHGLREISDFVEQQQKEIKKLSSEVAVKDSFVVTFRNKNNKLEKENDALKEELSALQSQPVSAVPTPFGTIIASKSTDPNYPGIMIDVQDNEGFVENAALVEYKGQENEIRVVYWKQGQEDYIDSIKWSQNPLTSAFSAEK